MGLPPQKMTLSDFLAWEEAQEERYEFVRGEVFAMVGVRRINGRVTVNLTALLHRALADTRCQVFVEALKVQVADDRIFYPDIVVTCDPSDLTAHNIFTAPRVIVEVLSPSTQAYDRSLKFALYRGLDSLQEYVLVDPDTRRIELFRKNAAGHFELHDMSDAETLEFASIGCQVAVAEVFAGLGTPPDGGRPKADLSAWRRQGGDDDAADAAAAATTGAAAGWHCTVICASPSSST